MRNVPQTRAIEPDLDLAGGGGMGRKMLRAQGLERSVQNILESGFWGEDASRNVMPWEGRGVLVKFA